MTESVQCNIYILYKKFQKQCLVPFKVSFFNVYAIISLFFSNGNVDGYVVVQLVQAPHYIIGSIPSGAIGIFHRVDPSATLWPSGRLRL